jgi:phage FluMu gp28-like protein
MDSGLRRNDEEKAAIGLLLGYQIKWLLDWSPVIVDEKSRRIGASFADALKSVMLAAKTKKRGGMDCFYLSYNKDMTRQYIKDCAAWAKKINAAAGEMEEIVVKDPEKDFTIFQIKFASGHMIQALPSEARNIRSKQGRVVIAEAAFVDDLPELLKAALALLMWGGQVAVLSTHNGVDNPFCELIADIRAGRFKYSRHRTTFDQAIEQGLFRAICREKGQAWSPAAEAAFVQDIRAQYGDKADEELDCVPSLSGGAFIPLNLIETAMHGGEDAIVRIAPPAPDFVDWPRAAVEAWTGLFILTELTPILAALDKKRRHVYGFDVGRVADLSVLWVLSEKENLDLETPLVIEMVQMPFKTQEAVMRAVEYGLPGFHGAAVDATGIGASLAEAARQEWGPDLVHEVKLSESWYSANLPPLKARFEDKALAIPKDTHIRDDLRQIKVIKGLPKLDNVRTAAQGGAKRHGDAAIALALADFALRQAPDSAPWEPAFSPPSDTSRMLERFNQ